MSVENGISVAVDHISPHRKQFTMNLMTEHSTFPKSTDLVTFVRTYMHRPVFEQMDPKLKIVNTE